MTLDKFVKDKAVLITTDVNRFYLSGFRSSFGFLFVINGEKILYVDSRYIEAAKKGAKKEVKVRLYEKISLMINDIKKEFSIKELFMEADITYAEKANYDKAFEGIEIIPSSELSDALIEARSIKTAEEIACILKAQSFAEKAFSNALNYIKSGITEKEIALKLEYDMGIAGSEGISFDTIVVSGKKSSMPHGVPTEKIIEDGDFVTMDFGAVFGGYHSDMTRTVAVEYATDEMIKVYETVLSAQKATLDILKAGVTGRDADKAARDLIAKEGYGEYFNHSTGHGVGLEIHEAPNLAPSCDKILNCGNVVTVEPGVYLEGKFGVRIEDMAVIKENGIENLTKSEKSLIILK